MSLKIAITPNDEAVVSEIGGGGLSPAVLSIVENGVYSAPEGEGYTQVTANVPQGWVRTSVPYYKAVITDPETQDDRYVGYIDRLAFGLINSNKFIMASIEFAALSILSASITLTSGAETTGTTISNALMLSTGTFFDIQVDDVDNVPRYVLFNSDNSDDVPQSSDINIYLYERQV